MKNQALLYKCAGYCKRKKWYLLPILSPVLGLPASHTKEPYYINMKTIEKWIADSERPDKRLLMQ